MLCLVITCQIGHAQEFARLDTCWCEGSPSTIYSDDFENQPDPGWGGFIEVWLSNASDLLGWDVTKGSISIHHTRHGDLGEGNGRGGRIHLDLNGSSIGGIKKTLRGLQPFVPTIISFQYAKHRGTDKAEANLQIDNGRTLNKTWSATNDGNTRWLTKQFVFLPSDSKTEIKFESLIEDPCCGMLIDNIIVQQCNRITIDTAICAGESFRGFNTSGQYTDIYPLRNGCDSTVYINLLVNPTEEIFIEHTICMDDTFKFGDENFFVPGDYTLSLTNQFGCDSIVQFRLNKIDCSINASSDNTDVRCHGNNNGSISFAVTGNGSPPFVYVIKNQVGDTIRMGRLTSEFELANIENLLADNYYIDITDALAGRTIIHRVISQPDPLDINFILSDYNGYNVSCSDAQDGRIIANASGGTAPYSYNWDFGSSSSTLDNLGAGKYALLVMDDNNCRLNVSTQLKNPLPLSFAVEAENIGCDNEILGSISIEDKSGGVAPYILTINNNTYLNDTTTFSDLAEGTYMLLLEDANGCEKPIDISIRQAVIPRLNMPDTIRIDLGESTPVVVVSNTRAESVNWRDDPGLNCYTCLSPNLVGTHTGYYQIKVHSEDNCSVFDSVYVDVNPVRNVFIPNSFSPNNDGINDEFQIFTGNGVQGIESFRIFNRWGNKIYDFRPRNERSKVSFWDGMIKGNAAPTDVYIYDIEILFIDGFSKRYRGELYLID